MSSNHQRSVFAGLGFALCYTPAIIMVGCYFRERRALAYGIGLSGSGIGTFVLAPLVQLLIDLYSWRGALLVLSAFVANLCVCGALLRPITVLDFKEEEESGEEKTTGKIRKQLLALQDRLSMLFLLIMRHVRHLFPSCGWMLIKIKPQSEAQNVFFIRRSSCHRSHIIPGC